MRQCDGSGPVSCYCPSGALGNRSPCCGDRNCVTVSGRMLPFSSSEERFRLRCTRASLRRYDASAPAAAPAAMATACECNVKIDLSNCTDREYACVPGKRKRVTPRIPSSNIGWSRTVKARKAMGRPPVPRCAIGTIRKLSLQEPRSPHAPTPQYVKIMCSRRARPRCPRSPTGGTGTREQALADEAHPKPPRRSCARTRCPIASVA